MTLSDDLLITYDHVWLHMNLYEYVWLYRALSDYVCLCIFIHYTVWVCIALYSSFKSVWLWMTLYDHVSLCMNMYDFDDFEWLHDSVRLYMTMYRIYMILYDVFDFLRPFTTLSDSKCLWMTLLESVSFT